ncbi:hypothetical protein B0H19DRAFT_1250509 [Mycena capillaripes]|nr:hypothetical protein B0H19DRAFT_1250509 [Mycena capillaripes]
MTTYKLFAVVGGGTVGSPIVAALAARNLIEVDYASAAAVAEVFKQHQVDVMLSTIATTAAAAQKSLADAAKLARIKLFIPSEYGLPTDGHTEGGLGAKSAIAGEYLKSLNIPSVRIYTGIFIEFIPWIVAYGDHGKFRITGKGDTSVSFTSISDIAGFVAHILTTLPASELVNRIFRVEGKRASLNSIAVQFNASVKHVDSINGEGGQFKTGLQGVIDTGAGSTGWDVANKAEGTAINAAGNANALWAGHHWKTIKEVHNL